MHILRDKFKAVAKSYKRLIVNNFLLLNRFQTQSDFLISLWVLALLVIEIFDKRYLPNFKDLLFLRMVEFVVIRQSLGGNRGDLRQKVRKNWRICIFEKLQKKIKNCFKDVLCQRCSRFYKVNYPLDDLEEMWLNRLWFNQVRVIYDKVL